MIAPSAIYNCCTEELDTSTQNSMWSFVVSINTLLRGVATPVSPIKAMTAPSPVVPSCLCPG
jgi:hypothetical protein